MPCREALWLLNRHRAAGDRICIYEEGCCGLCCPGCNGLRGEPGTARCCKGTPVRVKEKEFETMILVTEGYSLDLGKGQQSVSLQGNQVG